ncbi:UbiC transcription regulator-associated domain protein [Acetobacteraceae bacterium AT-5844]|nr:UbiC transcription regulator-associated domain protein [Acetobacteraceae bacterium AT-5844]
MTLKLADMAEEQNGGRMEAIHQALLRRIEQGEIAASGRLPAERLLCEHYATHRVTMHEVLLRLEAEGRIYREGRRGWFVSPPRFRYDPLGRGHFERSVREQGRQPHTQLLDATMVEPPPLVRHMMQWPEGAPMLRIRRLRSIDRRPVLYVEHYLDAERLPGLLQHDLSVSLTELYRAVYGLTYGYLRFNITPAALPAEAAQPLRAARGSPALLIARLNHARDGVTRDCDLEYWRHDAVLVEVESREMPL